MPVLAVTAAFPRATSSNGAGQLSSGQVSDHELLAWVAGPLDDDHVEPVREHGVGLVKRDYLEHELGESTVDAMRRVSLDTSFVPN